MQQEETKKTGSWRQYLLVFVPLVLIACYWFTRPFSDQLSSAHTRTASLSKAQLVNIKLACSRIDGIMLKPQESFSFNRVVKERTFANGFVSAPEYLEGATVSAPGGGICLVSSLLYRAALEAGLTVEERSPHTATVSTIPPGFDATVSYGRKDLKLRNTTGEPVRIAASCEEGSAAVTIYGSRGRGKNAGPLRLSRQEEHTGDRTSVSVFRHRPGKKEKEMVSRDLYRIRRAGR